VIAKTWSFFLAQKILTILKSKNYNQSAIMSCSRIVVLLSLIAGSRLSAQLVDNLDTTFNFDSGFNGTSATANGDGTVTLSRTQSGLDAGVDWMQGGTSFLSLASEDLLTITPAASGSANGGTYNVNILFWTGTGDFVTEVNWLNDSTSTSPQTLDVGQFAADNGVSAIAADYFVRFRIEPQAYSGADPGFAFDKIQAVPEPGFVQLSCLGFLALGYVIKMRR
jgi:hypothetical protein